MNKYSRRRFLQSTAGAVAAWSVLPHAARADVNSQIRVAVVGLNGRGRNLIAGFKNNLVALCDCDEKILGQRATEFDRKYHRQLEQIADYRTLLDRKDIDVISIATPDQTHALIAIEAALAGKHVYVEKPVSQYIWEGRQMVNAARHNNRLMQCGTQARSAKCLQEAVAYVHSGKLGKILYAYVTCFKPRPSIGKLAEPLKIPSTINYDLWCGPAAKVDLYRPKLHYDWHWDFNTGGGDMTNQALHQVDVARWFLGQNELSPRVTCIGGRVGYEDAGNTPNTLVAVHDYPAAPIVIEIRGLPKSKADQSRWDVSMDTFRQSQIGVIVQCEQGYIYSPSTYEFVQAFGPDGRQIERWTGGGDHFQNFLDALRSGRREDLNADILEGHLSAALCDAANISYRVGTKRTSDEIEGTTADYPMLEDSVDRMLAHLRANDVDVAQPVLTLGPWLEMDPASERFTNSEPANQLLRRHDRDPFVVPEVA